MLLVAMVLALPWAHHPPAAAATPVEFIVSSEGGAPFSTLSGAVAVAPRGSIIRIHPGIYRETVVIARSLTLVGTDPDGSAILDGEGRRHLLRIVGPAVVRCENLVFRHGNATTGPGVEVRDGAAADFLACTFHDNVARQDAGAVAVSGLGSWAEFIGCHFQHNRAAGDGGAIATAPGGEVTLRDCTFFANRAAARGGAVALEGAEPLAVEGCLFIENEGTTAGAILVADGPVRLDGNTFFRNVSFDGASVHVGERDGFGSASITRNIFCGDQEGAGLAPPAVVERACNVYYDNFRGPLVGARPAADEVVTNPRFCDFRGLDLTLRRGSPAAGAMAECGLIGALGVGCLEALEATGPVAPHRLIR